MHFLLHPVGQKKKNRSASVSRTLSNDEIRGSEEGQAGAGKTRETKSAHFHQPRQQSKCKHPSKAISVYIKQMLLKTRKALIKNPSKMFWNQLLYILYK